MTLARTGISDRPKILYSARIRFSGANSDEWAMNIGNDSNPFVNFLIGLVIGVAGTFLYIRFGIELPSAGGVGQRLTSEAIVKTAEWELFNADNSPLAKRRALAVILANQPEKFLKIDQSIGNRFFAEFIRQNVGGIPFKGAVTLDSDDAPIRSIGLPEYTDEAGTIMESAAGLTLGSNRLVDLSARTRIQQQYPQASKEIIEFLLAHPELVKQSNQQDTGRLRIGLGRPDGLSR